MTILRRALGTLASCRHDLNPETSGMSYHFPTISVVMPCFNEGKTIRRAVESLLDGCPPPGCELVVVDGGSTDDTLDELRRLQEEGRGLTVLHNPRRLQVFALNQGVLHASGEIVVRADAHCVYPPGYAVDCARLLVSTGADNVGGVMVPVGETPAQKAVAMAMSHPIGVGNAKFHLGGYCGEVDTVFLGTFWRRRIIDIGGFDERALPANEDAELNIRIIKAGGRVLLDDSIRVSYFPRPSLKALWKQYLRYGSGRAYTIMKHKTVTSYRQVGPPVMVACTVLSIAFAAILPWLLIFPFSYAASVFAVCAFKSRRSGEALGLRVRMACAVLAMHTAWGIGMIGRVLSAAVNKSFRKKTLDGSAT